VTLADDELTYPTAGLLAEAPGTTRSWPIGPVQVDAGDDLPLAAPIIGRLDLARTNRGLLVRAGFETALAGTCSRCLRAIAMPLDLTIDEEALPSVDLASGQVLDPTDEPEVVRLTSDHRLRLLPLIVEAIQLAEPIAPVCRPDCPGLCPVCGRDLSEPGHEAHGVDIDPRLEVLRGFRVDGGPETD
jgi:uncharacterized protein